MDQGEMNPTSADIPDIPVRGVSKLPLYIMTAVVAFAVLLIIALAVARGPAEFDAASPEAAVQNFFIATLESDGQLDSDEYREAVSATLTPRARAACDQELRESTASRWRSDSRAELDEVTVDGTSATAKVEIRRTGGDPFNDWDSSSEQTLKLEQIDGVWLVDETSYDWQLRRCTQEN